VADARLRNSLSKALVDGTDQSRIDGLTKIYGASIITMLRRAEGTNDERITICPSPDEAKGGLRTLGIGN